MNSVGEALHFGVPMIVSPISNDQPMNTEKLVELEVGRQVNMERISAENLWHEVLIVLNDCVMKERVLGFSREISSVNGGEVAGEFLLGIVGRGGNE